jgi:hypothetical protein
LIRGLLETFSFIYLTRLDLYVESEVHRFVNFGQRPWWYGGHFCQKAGKKLGWIKNMK